MLRSLDDFRRHILTISGMFQSGNIIAPTRAIASIILSHATILSRLRPVFGSGDFEAPTPSNSNTTASNTRKTFDSLRTQPASVFVLFPIAVWICICGLFLFGNIVPIPKTSHASLKEVQLGFGGM